MNRDSRQRRSLQTQLIATRAEQDSQGMFIEGYFAVFSKPTELWPKAFEEIAPEAFNETMGNDIRGLINHETTLVLGRNKAGTLELRVDSHGLWGKITINPNDSDAVNLYERVKRGDVDQCSFGFMILDEGVEYRDDGSVKWTIRKVDLFEVSVCTFPAYEDTGVQARQVEYGQYQQRQLDQRKQKLKERVKHA